MSAEEKWVAYQDDVLKRLAWELKSGEATNSIAGMVVGRGDYDVLQIWTLREFGYSGEILERLKVMVNYKNDFSAIEWGYLMEKYVAKATLAGLSVAEAKKKFVSVIEQGYKIIEKLGKIFNDNERKKKEKASKQEAEKAHNRRWYQ